MRTLKLIYQPDVEQDCKENIREFLDYLHECEATSKELQTFVYNVIKHFAEGARPAYQNSNLIDLMNKVVERRRGEIFAAENIKEENNDR